MAASPILKVSVLSSGEVYLDGEQLSLERLRARIESAKAEQPAVWYYREPGLGEAPESAIEVMKMVAANRLPIRLCSKPDFSDGASLTITPWDGVMAEVREKTAGGKYVAVVRPNHTYLLIAPPSRDSMPAQMVQAIEKMAPPQPLRQIRAIADVSFSMKAGGGVPSLAETGKAIPFFGMLLGMACIGHSVCVFGGTDDSMAPACKGAELLIVDEAQLPSLPGDWKTVAGAAMRSRNIVVHDRTSFKLTRQ